MPAIFEELAFEFAEDPVPEHIEGFPEYAKDPAKYHLDGLDTFSHESYPLARDIDDMPTTMTLYHARMRILERTQPTSSSGGQGGIQDRVLIISPRVEAQI